MLIHGGIDDGGETLGDCFVFNAIFETWSNFGSVSTPPKLSGHTITSVYYKTEQITDLNSDKQVIHSRVLFS